MAGGNREKTPPKSKSQGLFSWLPFSSQKSKPRASRSEDGSEEGLSEGSNHQQPAGRNTAFLNASAVPLPADDAAASPLAADSVPGPSVVAAIKSQPQVSAQSPGFSEMNARFREILEGRQPSPAQRRASRTPGPMALSEAHPTPASPAPFGTPLAAPQGLWGSGAGATPGRRANPTPRGTPGAFGSALQPGKRPAEGWLLPQNQSQKKAKRAKIEAPEPLFGKLGAPSQSPGLLSWQPTPAWGGASLPSNPTPLALAEAPTFNAGFTDFASKIPATPFTQRQSTPYTGTRSSARSAHPRTSRFAPAAEPMAMGRMGSGVSASGQAGSQTGSPDDPQASGPPSRQSSLGRGPPPPSTGFSLPPPRKGSGNTRLGRSRGTGGLGARPHPSRAVTRSAKASLPLPQEAATDTAQVILATLNNMTSRPLSGKRKLEEEPPLLLLPPPSDSNGLPDMPKDPLPDWMKKGRKPLKQFAPVDLSDEPTQGPAKRSKVDLGIDTNTATGSKHIAQAFGSPAVQLPPSVASPKPTPPPKPSLDQEPFLGLRRAPQPEKTPQPHSRIQHSENEAPLSSAAAVAQPFRFTSQPKSEGDRLSVLLEGARPIHKEQYRSTFSFGAKASGGGSSPAVVKAREDPSAAATPAKAVFGSAFGGAKGMLTPEAAVSSNLEAAQAASVELPPDSDSKESDAGKDDQETAEPAKAGASQGAVGGWGKDFLASNAAQSALATAAVEKEQAQAAKPAPTLGLWGSAAPETSTAQSTQPPSSATADQAAAPKAKKPTPIVWDKSLEGGNDSNPAPAASKPSPAAATWGKSAFPATSAAAHFGSQKADDSTATPIFGLGSTKEPAPAPAEANPAFAPVANGGSWGAAFLNANKQKSSEAAAAAAAEVEKASGKGGPAGDSASPAPKITFGKPADTEAAKDAGGSAGGWTNGISSQPANDAEAPKMTFGVQPIKFGITPGKATDKAAEKAADKAPDASPPPAVKTRASSGQSDSPRAMSISPCASSAPQESTGFASAPQPFSVPAAWGASSGGAQETASAPAVQSSTTGANIFGFPPSGSSGSFGATTSAPSFAVGGASAAASSPGFGANPFAGFNSGSNPSSAPSFGSTTPSFGAASSAPNFGFGSSTPAASSGGGFAFGGSSAAGTGSAPGAQSAGGFTFGSTAPAASAPAFAFGASAPASGGQTAPNFGFGGSTPAAGGTSGAPFQFGSSGASAPAFGQGTSAPAFGQGNSAPAFGQGNSAPAFGQGNNATAFGQGTSTPAFGQGNSAPAFGQSTSVPAFGQGSSTPAFGQGAPQSGPFQFGGSAPGANSAPGVGGFGAAPAPAFGENPAPAFPAPGGPFGGVPAPAFGGATMGMGQSENTGAGPARRKVKLRGRK